MLRKGRISDAKALAKIHISELHADFLPQLGEKFLSLLYTNFFQSENTSIWVAEEEKHLQGFIVGSEHFSSVFKKILTKHFVSYALLLLAQIVKRPSIIKNVFETFFYIRKEGANLPDAELIVISILKKYQRKGLGRELVFKLERTLLSHGIKTYKVSVNATNSAANAFYTSVGFKKHSEFTLYGKKLYLLIKHIQ